MVQTQKRCRDNSVFISDYLLTYSSYECYKSEHSAGG